ncbi:hypothetical protein MVEN_00109100 [Mycena venus]|uniref:Uncharacterized protein n=1 Tax=Mycena venus TaxID=2733690 RepID=A0A8H7DFI3_9AGAR|nr:hypothetical protein MVEN_00109100 [Mycena venus]
MPVCMSSSASAPVPRGRLRRLKSTTATSQHGAAKLRASAQGGAPARSWYFVIWGTGIVYSTSYATRLASDEVFENREELELLSTAEWEIALAYAAGEDI